MSRTNPDPVFAAAAQAELERRIRARRPVSTASRPRRAWAMELAAVGGVLVLVAAVAAGVTAIRPSLDDGGAPIGSVTTAVTPSPTTTSSETPEAGPTSDAPATTAPPTVPATRHPTSPPPTAPTTTSTTPTVTPPPARRLLGPTGAKQRSSAEIRSWALSLGNDEIWAEQAVLDTSCMAALGFLYDPEYVYRAGLAAQHVGLTDAQYQAFQVAYSGPETNAPYDWRTAGCHGRSVHETGQDDAN